MGNEEIDPLAKLSKDECSLLLYFESIAVDRRAVVDPQKMNNEDRVIATRWDKAGFCSFKRFTERHSGSGAVKTLTHVVALSDDAWTLAHAERRARAARTRAI